MEVVKVWIEHYEFSKCCNVNIMGRIFKDADSKLTVLTCSHCKEPIQDIQLAELAQ